MPFAYLVRRMRLLSFAWVPLLFLATAAAASSGRSLTKATFIPQWVPQAQFAGYYVAYERGFYEKHGIDLKIIPGGPERGSDEFLKNGKAHFATMWLSAGILMRSKGVKVVNIAQMVQRSALMLVAKKSSGIQSYQDIQGKKVGLWSPIFQVQPRAFFKKYNLQVREVRQSYAINLFLRDAVDVASAMWYNEYHTILNSGLNPDELTTFFFHEHGLNFPEDGIYTLEDTFTTDPDLCVAFVRASVEGWRYAFAHPEEALDIVMRNLRDAHIPATRVHQRWMLNRMRDLMIRQDAETPIGMLEPVDHDRVTRELRESGLIEDIPEITSFHRRCYPHAEK